ncbi:MAG: anti-sigma factor family protein [Ramlibacter sp.]
MKDDPMPELPAEVKQNMTRYKAPPGLERRIRYMLAQPSRGPGLLERVRASSSRWLPLAASFAAGAVLAVSAVLLSIAPADDDAIERQVVASHVRSLMADHLTDVPSTDQHTVKPWFNGKLDYAPPVVDLASQGFPLAGGRLDYLGDRPVAALVYRRRSHAINLFVLPARDGQGVAARFEQRQGYQVAHWSHAGMRFWAVSDLGREELAAFAAAVQAAS